MSTAVQAESDVRRETRIPSSMRIVTEGKFLRAGDERFLVKTYANGQTVRDSIVKGPRTKRYPDRPYWHWTFD